MPVAGGNGKKRCTLSDDLVTLFLEKKLVRRDTRFQGKSFFSEALQFGFGDIFGAHPPLLRASNIEASSL